MKYLIFLLAFAAGCGKKEIQVAEIVPVAGHYYIAYADGAVGSLKPGISDKIMVFIKDKHTVCIFRGVR